MYKKVVWRYGKKLLSAELNELQKIEELRTSGVFNLLAGKEFGAISVTAQTSTNAAKFSAVVFAFGEVFNVTEASISNIFPSISPLETAEIYMKVQEVLVTETEDPSLIIPILGEATSYRLRYDLTLGKSAVGAIPPNVVGAGAGNNVAYVPLARLTGRSVVVPTVDFTPHKIYTARADHTKLADRDNLFVSEDVEGALKELFTHVSDGKNAIAAAITDVGVPANGNETFSSLADKIRSILMSLGNALPTDVRAGKVFSNAMDAGLVGTLPVRDASSAVVVTPSQDEKVLQPGIYDQPITIEGGNYRAGDYLYYTQLGLLHPPVINVLSNGEIMLSGVSGDSSGYAYLSEISVDPSSGKLAVRKHTNTGIYHERILLDDPQVSFDIEGFLNIAIYGDMIYALYGSAAFNFRMGVSCYQLDGTHVWSREHSVATHQMGSEWGLPLVVRESAVYHLDERDTLYKINRQTGEVVWSKKTPILGNWKKLAVDQAETVIYCSRTESTGVYLSKIADDGTVIWDNLKLSSGGSVSGLALEQDDYLFHQGGQIMSDGSGYKYQIQLPATASFCVADPDDTSIAFYALSNGQFHKCQTLNTTYAIQNAYVNNVDNNFPEYIYYDKKSVYTGSQRNVIYVVEEMKII